MAQSYVGKCSVSKGIRTVIRKFVVSPFTPDVPERQRPASAHLMDDRWRRRSHGLRNVLIGVIAQLPVAMMLMRPNTLDLAAIASSE
jgi:hypothetical protein